MRLSTLVTAVAVVAFVSWNFRSRRLAVALYNGVVAAFFTVFLYEILFNLTGRFPPTDMLPPWGIALMLGSVVLGLFQARRHFVVRRPSVILFLAFSVDWLVWLLVGFPFNLPSTQPINLIAEAFNVSTKLLLPFGYATGLVAERESVAADS